MAQQLLICRPGRVVDQQSATANLARLLSPEPKEAFAFPADNITRAIDLDFGEVVTIDVVYLGYHDVVGPGPVWSFRSTDALGGGDGAIHFAGQPLAAAGDGTPRQTLRKLAAPAVGRFFRISFNPGGVAFHAGVLALGPSLTPVHGHEWDSGRLIEDTGSVERRLDGGFGIDEGVAAGGYEWSFDSLTPGEVTTLYRWAKERRTTRSILVAEAGGAADEYPSECLHWGLFDKFERFSRRDPENTRWALRVRDWA